MDPKAPVRAFDRFQRRHTPLAFVIAVLRNFSDQQAGNSVVLIAYYAFLSIFPLLLAFISILGFVLQGDPSARATIVDSAPSPLWLRTRTGMIEAPYARPVRPTPLLVRSPITPATNVPWPDRSNG